jgi:hypothetical protein
MRKKLTLISILALYLTSMSLVCFRTIGTFGGFVHVNDEWRAYQILALGWLGLLDGTIAWYANVFLVLGLLHLGRRDGRCLTRAVLGLCTGLSALLYQDMFYDEKLFPRVPVVDWSAGYFLWLSCFLVLVASASVGMYQAMTPPRRSVVD